MDPFDLIRDGRIKRYFRATKKLRVPNLIYHITQRATGKGSLFLEESDYLFMLWLLKEMSHRYSLKIYAFCLMPNHLHILLSPERDNLYDVMRNLFSRYAMKFNQKYGRKGHLFGGPYRQAVCLDGNYLLAASLYIHLNPVRAELATDPLKYRWSSCTLYCETNIRKSFVKAHFILGLISNSKVESKKQYRRFLRLGRKLQADHVLEHKNAIERFQSSLNTKFPSIFDKVEKKRKIIIASGLNLLGPNELDKTIDQMRKEPLPNQPESRKTKKYIIEQLIARGYKRKEIAVKLGMSRKTVYNLLKSHL